MAYIKVYERDITGIRYPSALAQSVHFAVSFGGTSFEPVKGGYGILYPKAEIGDKNNILERGVKAPRIAYIDGKYYIFGEYADKNGNILSLDSVYLWEGCDITALSERGLVKKSDIEDVISAAKDRAPITTESAAALIDKYSVLQEIRRENTENGIVITYSDGSSETVKEDISYPAPAYEGFADPVVFDYDGKKYCIGTNVKTNCVGLYIMGGTDTVCGLFDGTHELSCILPYNEELGFCSTFWAPEFHRIGDDHYILFAVGRGFSPQCHVMKLKRGGDILSADGWETPLRVKRKNGEFLVTERGAITLDMTYIHAKGRHYYAWSERYGVPADSGSMIYIAEFDPSRPDILTTDPVLLTRPIYGWENQSGTVNNEGPHPLYSNGKIYLTYSVAAAGGFSYTVSYLSADENADLLDISSWTKLATPIFSAYDLVGIEGPGHGAFATGDEGETIFVYHAQPLGVSQRRLTYINRVRFDKNGAPRLAPPKKR